MGNQDEVGQLHRGQDDLKEEAKRYFKKLFTKDLLFHLRYSWN
jgi:hypothetical protein